ncbi:28S ribosomal protein S33, mitochondrial [Halotydeus destructor]|nr:28S ribosomal protein S33, mitochondrial [Halotydeus destructor]
MSWYKIPSNYSQKMKRLSCKIFGEYYTPPAPAEYVYMADTSVLARFNGHHYQNEQQTKRQSALPFDLNPDKNPNYYPAHPQIRSLVHTLRLHGLFRDEHMDFVDEMKRLRVLRGKKYRVKGGGGGKRAQLK